MLSLVFICSRRLVSDHSSLRRALHLIPQELYPLLFRAAFQDEKTLVLQDLVERWPFSVLSLRRLLQSDERRHFVQVYQNSKLCVQTVILGVMAYLREELARHNEGRPLRKLRILDLTGSYDDELEPPPQTFGVWSRTATLAKSCIDISRRQSIDVGRVSKRRKGLEETVLSSAADHGSVCVEVRVDLFVNNTSYSVLREALRVGTHGPLRLQCRDFRAEELSLDSTVELLELLNPAGLRQIDLRFNNLRLSGVNTLLPYLTRFSHLQSLKLPYSNIDVTRYSPTTEEAMQNFASQICQLPALKELNLESSRLSGRLRQMLGGLQTPLESLELAFCRLLPADLLYLSRSLHISSLKKLDLSGNNLSEVLLQPFLQLLGSVSSSLLYLDIMECKLSDSVLLALTPVLLRCCCLRYLGLVGNWVSAQSLKTLLRSSLHLRDLQLVISPIPAECYLSAAPELAATSRSEELIARFQAEVQEVLVGAQRTDILWVTGFRKHSPPEYLSL